MRLQIGNQVVDLNFPGNFKGVVAGVFLALILFTLYKSYYTVRLEEEAVITRFGKYMKTVGPGLHFKVPWVDRAEKKETSRNLNMEFGFTGSSSTSRRYTSALNAERDMVTGDLNAASVTWVVQYKITDAAAYLFNVEEPEETLHDATESVMREVVGDRTVDEVLTIGRQEIESECQRKLGELIGLYQLGITIDLIQLNDVNPPGPVQASFSEVNQAQQEREKMTNIANGEYNKAVPKAKGDADKLITEAEGYATKRINEAEGDVAKFVALYKEYEKSPDVTRRRIYLETMENVMPQLGKKVIIDESANQVLPFLPLNSTK